MFLVSVKRSASWDVVLADSLPQRSHRSSSAVRSHPLPGAAKGRSLSSTGHSSKTLTRDAEAAQPPVSSQSKVAASRSCAELERTGCGARGDSHEEHGVRPGGVVVHLGGGGLAPLVAENQESLRLIGGAAMLRLRGSAQGERTAAAEGMRCVGSR